MKKIFFIIFLTLIIFVIYFFCNNKKIYLVSLGDHVTHGLDNCFVNIVSKKNISNIVNASQINDYRVMDLINDIKYNKEILYKRKKYKFQNLLVKSNLMIVSIGMNDIIYKKYSENKEYYNYIDQLLKDIEDLFDLIRKYNKDEIYVLNFYNIIENKKIIEYANNRLSMIANDYNIKVIDISKLYKYTSDNSHITEYGYNYITKKINMSFTKL